MMKSKPKLLNPNRQLLNEIETQLIQARKTKPLWAKQVDKAQQVETLEGLEQVAAGDYLCRGINDEVWPQSQEKLLQKYTVTGETDSGGWQKFEPKPDAPPVEAAQIDEPFRVASNWGELTGKPGDYLVRSTTDPKDIWIVDQQIFESTYEVVASTD